MGVIIQNETTMNPISLMGQEAGICWGANVLDQEKNFLRGVDCLQSGHMRTAEFPQIYVVLDGYSARVIRELYTHIGGGPTRLQASTRYIDYKNFDYIIPPSIEAKQEEGAIYYYEVAMSHLRRSMEELLTLGVPKEDVANLLPLGMTTKVVLRTNLRNLIDMSHQRLCTRAYWEFRKMMRDIINALREYSDEWKILIDEYNVFQPKCDACGFCTEKYSCGRQPKKSDLGHKSLSQLTVDLKISLEEFIESIESEKIKNLLKGLVDKK